ncbi:hypothetical protein ED733_005075 [Metarhizium rileyi]|uniref:Enterotoxin n=1 Tax=Metarhizium rileyi (strain RCEF 4871) TaxID=1649241 RepID=A0A5C6GCH9_METRR|nr:hypothetical protein ED733_005075 [Metarhizium rileyi]
MVQLTPAAYPDPVRAIQVWASHRIVRIGQSLRLYAFHQGPQTTSWPEAGAAYQLGIGWPFAQLASVYRVSDAGLPGYLENGGRPNPETIRISSYEALGDAILLDRDDAVFSSTNREEADSSSPDPDEAVSSSTNGGDGEHGNSEGSRALVCRKRTAEALKPVQARTRDRKRPREDIVSDVQQAVCSLPRVPSSLDAPSTSGTQMTRACVMAVTGALSSRGDDAAAPHTANDDMASRVISPMVAEDLCQQPGVLEQMAPREQRGGGGQGPAPGLMYLVTARSTPLLNISTVERISEAHSNINYVSYQSPGGAELVWAPMAYRTPALAIQNWASFNLNYGPQPVSIIGLARGPDTVDGPQPGTSYQPGVGWPREQMHWWAPLDLSPVVARNMEQDGVDRILEAATWQRVRPDCPAAVERIAARPRQDQAAGPEAGDAGGGQARPGSDAETEPIKEYICSVVYGRNENAFVPNDCDETVLRRIPGQPPSASQPGRQLDWTEEQVRQLGAVCADTNAAAEAWTRELQRAGPADAVDAAASSDQEHLPWPQFVARVQDQLHVAEQQLQVYLDRGIQWIQDNQSGIYHLLQHGFPTLINAMHRMAQAGIIFSTFQDDICKTLLAAISQPSPDEPPKRDDEMTVGPDAKKPSAAPKFVFYGDFLWPAEAKKIGGFLPQRSNPAGSAYDFEGEPAGSTYDFEGGPSLDPEVKIDWENKLLQTYPYFGLAAQAAARKASQSTRGFHGVVYAVHATPNIISAEHSFAVGGILWSQVLGWVQVPLNYTLPSYDPKEHSRAKMQEHFERAFKAQDSIPGGSLFQPNSDYDHKFDELAASTDFHDLDSPQGLIDFMKTHGGAVGWQGDFPLFEPAESITAESSAATKVAKTITPPHELGFWEKVGHFMESHFLALAFLPLVALANLIPGVGEAADVAEIAALSAESAEGFELTELSEGATELTPLLRGASKIKVD